MTDALVGPKPVFTRCVLEIVVQVTEPGVGLLDCEDVREKVVLDRPGPLTSRHRVDASNLACVVVDDELAPADVARIWVVAVESRNIDGCDVHSKGPAAFALRIAETRTISDTFPLRHFVRKDLVLGACCEP